MNELDPDIVLTLGFALACGLLIGLERGWTARGAVPGSRVAGFRTFGLIGLLGGICGLIDPAVAAVLVTGVMLVILVGYWRSSDARDRLSSTNAISAALTLALGYLATSGHDAAAVAGAAVVALLLSLRETLHRWLRGLREDELRAAIRFALIALVIWPLAPDRSMGPLDAWNPHRLWFVVVLVCGLSFIAFITGRRAAASKGLLVTAACGAAISSTAVTAACARLMKNGGDTRLLTAAILIASVIMYARICLLSALLAPVATLYLTIILLPGTLLLVIPMSWRLRQPRSAEAQVALPVENPLELAAALGLAGIVAIMTLAGKWASIHYGNLGLAATLLITGFADVDAAIVTLANSDPGAMSPRLAGMLLAGPILANIFVKATLAAALARNRGGWVAGGWLAASGAVSGAMLLALL